jgi:predicted nuclease of restriction endonuclease-like (RecB) superfamily
MGNMPRKRKPEDAGIPARKSATGGTQHYGQLVTGISGLLDDARRTVVRSTNHVIVATYWEIGRRIVEFEQSGRARADYGEDLLPRLARDLTQRYGRGFSKVGLYRMRTFYLNWQILSTPLREFQSVVESTVRPHSFPLSWSHYIRLMSVENRAARTLYEAEAIRSGWSVRQLDRQISTQFFERFSASANPERMLAAARKPAPVDPTELQHHIRDPYLLEFLDLKDEYSESDLEDAIVRHLESFLLELGAGFTFVARQKRIRIGDEWYRIDLLLYHRTLRCLVVVDLKIGRFSHADAGQMNLYLNYSREHLMGPDEHEPVGLILCSAKNDAVVHYAMGGINANVFASRYLTVLPDTESLRQEIIRTQRAFLGRLR